MAGCAAPRTGVCSLDTSLNVRHTFWSTVCLGFAMTINIIALDQPIYQRLASVRSLRISKRVDKKTKRKKVSNITETRRNYASLQNIKQFKNAGVVLLVIFL
ncbi:hypothetical protein E2C01_077880 [Portunus trituberculatus]|uniref:Uncharacterized protein n=1 Tax=Portunus trituberculatus TaxID=210409 RepID=A0A5B7ICJ2_PORTR|nr:hypothetical protein [Portunus trituberculatus]